MDAIKRVLPSIWKAWKKFGEFLGGIIGRAFLMIFYFTLALPFGIGTRLFGDPLDMRRGRPISWVERTSPDPTLEGGYRQF